MDPVNGFGPELDERRVARRKAHLMNEIDSKVRGRAPRRRLVLTVVAVAGVAAALTGGAAVLHLATGGSVVPQGNGQYAIDGSTLRPVYQGRYVSLNELEHLKSEGKATTSVNNAELACQGISLYFDTDEQLQAYMDDFAARDAQYKAARPSISPTEGPCVLYADAPRYVTEDE